MRTASSPSLRPQALMGSAKSQSPECGDVTAFILGWWFLDVVEVIRAARSLLMSGLSQADYLWARDSSGTGAPDSADHCSKPKTRGRSSGTLQLDRMEACSDAVPAAEAKKAGNASENTRRMPRPPSRIGRVAWSQLQSARATFKLFVRPSRIILCNPLRNGGPMHG